MHDGAIGSNQWARLAAKYQCITQGQRVPTLQCKVDTDGFRFMMQKAVLCKVPTFAL